jgi:hypothetical protein
MMRALLGSGSRAMERKGDGSPRHLGSAIFRTGQSAGEMPGRGGL